MARLLDPTPLLKDKTGHDRADHGSAGGSPVESDTVGAGQPATLADQLSQTLKAPKVPPASPAANDAKHATAEHPMPAPGDGEVDPVALAHRITLGSLQLEPNAERKPLRDRVLRTLLRTVLEPTRGSHHSQEGLNWFSTLMDEGVARERSDRCCPKARPRTAPATPH